MRKPSATILHKLMHFNKSYGIKASNLCANHKTKYLSAIPGPTSPTPFVSSSAFPFFSSIYLSFPLYTFLFLYIPFFSSMHISFPLCIFLFLYAYFFSSMHLSFPLCIFLFLYASFFSSMHISFPLRIFLWPLPLVLLPYPRPQIFSTSLATKSS